MRDAAGLPQTHPGGPKSLLPAYKMHMTEAACCIFMLFFLLRMLSEDWYTWMLRRRGRKTALRLP